jgi:hypothetical protein
MKTDPLSLEIERRMLAYREVLARKAHKCRPAMENLPSIPMADGGEGPEPGRTARSSHLKSS